MCCVVPRGVALLLVRAMPPPLVRGPSLRPQTDDLAELDHRRNSGVPLAHAVGRPAISHQLPVTPLLLHSLMQVPAPDPSVDKPFPHCPVLLNTRSLDCVVVAFIFCIDSAQRLIRGPLCTSQVIYDQPVHPCLTPPPPLTYITSGVHPHGVWFGDPFPGFWAWEGA